ncbi:DUF1080 domain-containing protein [Clostridium sp. YIM B02505]|uniref:DUF1080 domain-containing protein n=1 Tax=Clostridium yunnanense TaxID=2800325 RepID=A0ABS1EK43_9CLOT|nr:family 16 glycoside hydrolase [Clostridium yunnanense]MBK1809738.1 DUF1080 domain-containing protein [Clostridium yunnanense]
MFNRKVINIFLFLVVLISTSLIIPKTVFAASTIQSYAMPSIYKASSAFSVKADNTNIPVISYVSQYDYSEFSFSGTVNIEVTASENINSYSISPMAKNITGTVSGNKLTFTLSTSTYVIVKINDMKKLVIAADPLETNIPASSGAGIYNVTSSKYNADKTGTSMATKAIQGAIDDAHNAGGGTVYVPAGVYKCGNLTLKSNVTFYLAGGSVIVGTGNGADYITDFNKSSLSKDGTYFIRTTEGSHDITIRGRGTIDGKGIDMRVNSNFLNNLLVPLATTNFTFDGIIMRDGGFWAFMPVRSKNVMIKNYKAFQSFDYLEADCFDANECQNVTVSHAIGLSDDDTFSTKTWMQTGMSSGWPGTVQNLDTVTFDDCLAWSKCVAFKIGMGTYQLQKNVNFKNSYVYQCSRALVVDHSYGTPAVQDVTFDNIDVERCDMTQFGNHWFSVGTSTSGPVNNVTFKNCNIRSTGGKNSYISGHDSTGTIDGVTFSNVRVLGKVATSLSDLNATQGSNVSNIRFSNSSTTILSDNFEDGDTSGWTSNSGSWSVATDGSNVLNQNATATSFITRGTAWTNYAYQAEAKLPITNANAGILFRVQDSNNYYMYRINGSTNSLELYKCVAGTLTQVSSTPFTVSSNQWYIIKAVVNGNNIKGYVNGRLLTDWTNPNTELTSGKIGFRTTSANVAFDDVLVTQ